GFFAISKKNRHLIPAFTRLQEEGLEFFRSQGPVDKTDINNVVVRAQKQQVDRYSVHEEVDNEALREIAISNKKMLENEAKKEEYIDMGSYIVVKSNNRVRRIRKNK